MTGARIYRDVAWFRICGYGLWVGWGRSRDLHFTRKHAHYWGRFRWKALRPGPTLIPAISRQKEGYEAMSDDLDEYLAGQIQNPPFRYAYERAGWVSARWWRRAGERWAPRLLDSRYEKARAALARDPATTPDPKENER